MGDRGPVPKRSEQRRRRNGEDLPPDRAAGADEVEVPVASDEWHPVAKAWFESLAKSGQSFFYEPSDWATAVVLAEALSRELGEQPIVLGKGEDAHIEWVLQPVTGATLSALLKGMSSLMVTEGDRRRLRLELDRPRPGDGAEEGAGSVSWLDDARRRAAGGPE